MRDADGQGDEARPRRSRREGADDGRPRRKRRADDGASPSAESEDGRAGTAGLMTAAGAVLAVLVVLSLLIRFGRLADKFDQGRREQREAEEARQQVEAARLAPKIPEFDANLAKLNGAADRFNVMYFSEQPFDPARQKAVARGLDRCLRSQDPWVGYDACHALKKWGDKNSVQPLVDFYHAHPEDHFRSRVLEALAAINDPAAAQAIRAINKRGA